MFSDVHYGVVWLCQRLVKIHLRGHPEDVFESDLIISQPSALILYELL